MSVKSDSCGSFDPFSKQTHMLCDTMNLIDLLEIYRCALSDYHLSGRFGETHSRSLIRDV